MRMHADCTTVPGINLNRGRMTPSVQPDCASSKSRAGTFFVSVWANVAVVFNFGHYGPSATPVGGETP